MDVHHGDGVEEAFFNCNRVMTLSYHQFGEGFFPKTGGMKTLRKDIPPYYSINVPIKKGCSDLTYKYIFTNILDDSIEMFKPDAIVLQSGADSLIGDELGAFNLSLRAHRDCFRYVLGKNLPTLCLGGGGYTKENVSRC